MVSMLVRHKYFGNLLWFVAKIAKGGNIILDAFSHVYLCVLIGNGVRRLFWHSRIDKDHLISGINEKILQ